MDRRFKVFTPETLWETTHYSYTNARGVEERWLNAATRVPHSTDWDGERRAPASKGKAVERRRRWIFYFLSAQSWQNTRNRQLQRFTVSDGEKKTLNTSSTTNAEPSPQSLPTLVLDYKQSTKCLKSLALSSALVFVQTNDVTAVQDHSKNVEEKKNLSTPPSRPPSLPP